MIKDQASALREMIRLKKEKQQSKGYAASMDKCEEVVQVTEKLDPSFVNPPRLKTEGALHLKETQIISQLFNEEISLKTEDTSTIQETKQTSIQIVGISGGLTVGDRSGLVSSIAQSFRIHGKTPLIIDLNVKNKNPEYLLTASLTEVLMGEKTIQEVCQVNAQGILVLDGGTDDLFVHLKNESMKERLEQQLATLTDIDMILVDMGSESSKINLLYSMFVQELILVVSPEPASVTEIYGFLKLMNHYQFKKEIQVIVHKAGNEQQAKKIFDLLQIASRKFLTLTLTFMGFVDFPQRTVPSPLSNHSITRQENSTVAIGDIRQVTQKLMDIETRKRTPQNMREVAQRFLHVFG